MVVRKGNWWVRNGSRRGRGFRKGSKRFKKVRGIGERCSRNRGLRFKNRGFLYRSVFAFIILLVNRTKT